jgi:hypothetical protein
MSEADEQDELDDEIEAEEPAAPAEPAPAPAAPAKRPRGRPRTVGAAPVSNASAWSDKDVSVMWPEMIAALKAAGKSPYDIDILVFRIDPPPGALLQTFSGGSVVGGQNLSPAKAIMDFIDQHVHMPTARTEAQYEVRFVKRNEGNQIFGRARVNRPAPEQLIAMRRAQQSAAPPYMQDYSGYGAPPPAAYGYPPPAPQAAPQAAPPAPMPPQTFGAPSSDPIIANMQSSLAFFSGQLQQTIQQGQQQARALDAIMQNLARQAGQPPPPPTAGVAAPPPVHASWLQPAPAPLAAPPPAVSSIDQIRGLVDQVRALRSLSREVDTLFAPEGEGTLGAPTETVTAPEPPTAPFDTVPIPEATLFGRPVHAAINKESRNIDWQGTVMSNPQLVEKGIEIATNFLQAVVKASGAKSLDATAPMAPAAPAPAALGQAVNGANGAAANGSGWPGV